MPDRDQQRSSQFPAARAVWICTFPGIAILLTVLGINLIGDGLNEALNPRLRDR